jgi:hypothetical protein
MSSAVHLTRAQKWDLARFAAAVAVSSVFFSVPMFVIGARSAPSHPEASAPSVTVAQEVAIASVSEPVVSSTPDQLEVPSPPRRHTVSVVTSTEVAQASSPALAGPNRVPALPNRLTPRPVQLRARTQTPATPVQPAKLTRRLARFIAGDGKYNVKPFPTVGTSGS